MFIESLCRRCVPLNAAALDWRCCGCVDCAVSAMVDQSLVQVLPLCRNREHEPSDYRYHFATPADRDRFAADCTSWDDPAAETADERIPIALERLPAGAS